MHDSLVSLQNEVDETIAVFQANVPHKEAFNIRSNSWNRPALSPLDILDDLADLSNIISLYDVDDLGSDFVNRLHQFTIALKFARANTISQVISDEPTAIINYIISIRSIRRFLQMSLGDDRQVSLVSRMASLRGTLKAIDDEIAPVLPKVNELSVIVGDIENAHKAAGIAQEDLTRISEMKIQIEAFNTTIRELLEQSGSRYGKLEKMEKEISKAHRGIQELLSESRSAYTTINSISLARAFGGRSKHLLYHSWGWIALLIISLGLGGFIGMIRLDTLSELALKPDVSLNIMLINVVVSVLALGAPVWLAWIATKQINQQLKLSEEYGYKASVFGTYEAFRLEAEKIDNAAKEELLEIIFARLNELPIRHIDDKNHGSPMQEITSSNIVKRAFMAVPGFATQVVELAREKVKERRQKTKPADEERE